MKILLAGGTGFIGSRLKRTLVEQGHDVIVLSTRKRENGFSHWDPARGKIDAGIFTGTDVIINLSGAGIADRLWTKKRKKLLLDSRVQSTRLLVNTIHKTGCHPRLFINASAIGYYGNRPAMPVNEHGAPGKGFLAHVTQAWEEETAPLQTLGVPLAILRIGIVLDRRGGSLPKLLIPVRFGMNIVFGKGSQYLSWIHIDDVVEVMRQLVVGTLPAGTYNLVAPEAVSQKVFHQQVKKGLRRRTINLYIPNALLHRLFGEMATLFSFDQQVVPAALMRQNYTFRYPGLAQAIEDLFGGK